MPPQDSGDPEAGREVSPALGPGRAPTEAERGQTRSLSSFTIGAWGPARGTSGQAGLGPHHVTGAWATALPPVPSHPDQPTPGNNSPSLQWAVPLGNAPDSRTLMSPGEQKAVHFLPPRAAWTVLPPPRFSQVRGQGGQHESQPDLHILEGRGGGAGQAA